MKIKVETRTKGEQVAYIEGMRDTAEMFANMAGSVGYVRYWAIVDYYKHLVKQLEEKGLK